MNIILNNVSAFQVCNHNNNKRDWQQHWRAVQKDDVSSSNESNKKEKERIFENKSINRNIKTKKEFQHGIAILKIPENSFDRIGNEAILHAACDATSKLSVVLKTAATATTETTETTTDIGLLRKHVGEVYSTLWDVAMQQGHILDVVVYAQNLPNTPPETWISHLPDLDVCCSHDSICGWTDTFAAFGRGIQYQTSSSTSSTAATPNNNKKNNNGEGGLQQHVNAINAHRKTRQLPPLQALHVHPWPKAACPEFHQENKIIFIDDQQQQQQQHDESTSSNNDNNDNEQQNQQQQQSSLLAGARIMNTLYNNVCVGGTFDGMHYGHRKLLTLAVSSVRPQVGQLLVGITVDEMLVHKQDAHLIAPFAKRRKDVEDFLHRLAPGIKNRIKLVPIRDPYGPPGSDKDFDALVLSDETLETGHALNRHRQALGMEPLALLCTRRTEAYSMSSTALRKWKRLRIL